MPEFLIEAPNPSAPVPLLADGIASVPDGTWERITLAFRRSLDYMPASAAAQLASVLDDETLWAAALALGVWAGLQFTGIGELATLAMAAYGALTVGRDVSAIIAAIAKAASASTPAAMEAVSRELADALLALGVDVVVGWLTGRLMAAFKTAVRAVRSPVSPNRWLKTRTPEKVGERPGERPTETEGRPSERPPRTEVRPGVLTGVGLHETGQQLAQVNWGAVAGVSVTALALAGLGFWALKRRSRERLVWRLDRHA